MLKKFGMDGHLIGSKMIRVKTLKVMHEYSVETRVPLPGLTGVIYGIRSWVSRFQIMINCQLSPSVRIIISVNHSILVGRLSKIDGLAFPANWLSVLGTGGPSVFPPHP